MHDNSPLVEKLLRRMADEKAKKHQREQRRRERQKPVDKKPEPADRIKGRMPSRAAIIEDMEVKSAAARKRAIDASPDLSRMQEVRIDSRTSIYIAPGQSVEEARQRFHEKHSR